MKTLLKHLLLAYTLILSPNAILFLTTVPTAHAEEFPDITKNGSANLKQSLKKGGTNIAEIIKYIVIIIAILAIMVAGGYFAARKMADGTVMVISALIGVIVTGVAYAIAKLGSVT